MPELTEEQIAAGNCYYTWNEVSYNADNTQGWTLITINRN